VAKSQKLECYSFRKGFFQIQVSFCRIYAQDFGSWSGKSETRHSEILLLDQALHTTTPGSDACSNLGPIDASPSGVLEEEDTVRDSFRYRYPLTIDEATLARVFGLYARVLVDVDMSERLFDSVLVEREGHAFPVAIEYEKQPFYCAHCKMLGHTLQNCKKISSKNDQDGTDMVKVAKRHQPNTTHTEFTVPVRKVVKQSKISQKVDALITTKSAWMESKESSKHLSKTDCTDKA